MEAAHDDERSEDDEGGRLDANGVGGDEEGVTVVEGAEAMEVREGLQNMRAGDEGGVVEAGRAEADAFTNNENGERDGRGMEGAHLWSLGLAFIHRTPSTTEIPARPPPIPARDDQPRLDRCSNIVKTPQTVPTAANTTAQPVEVQSTRGSRKRKAISHLADCLCGSRVNADEIERAESVVRCRKPGCETEWVSRFFELNISRNLLTMSSSTTWHVLVAWSSPREGGYASRVRVPRQRARGDDSESCTELSRTLTSAGE